MKQSRWWRTGLRSLTAVLMGGTLLQLDCLSKVVRNVNPCGTVLNCDPLEYDLQFADYPDYERDPTCTIPGLCGGWFPLGTGGNTVDQQ